MTPDEIKQLRELAEKAAIKYEDRPDIIKGEHFDVIYPSPPKGWEDKLTFAFVVNDPKKILSLLDHIDRLQKQNDKMREALEWYANEQSYFEEPTRGVDGYGNQIFAMAEVMIDEGRFARQALEECEELLNGDPK